MNQDEELDTRKPRQQCQYSQVRYDRRRMPGSIFGAQGHGSGSIPQTRYENMEPESAYLYKVLESALPVSRES